MKRFGAFSATALVMLGGLCGDAVGQQEQSGRKAHKAVRALVGVDEVSFAIEGDLVSWKDLHVVASVHRWPFAHFGCARTIIEGTGEGDRKPYSPVCTPAGWGVGAGARSTPRLVGRLRLFLQGELGYYRYDGGGILTPLISGRVGVVLPLSQAISAEAGVKLQRMAGYEWSGYHYGSKVAGALQIGFGISVR